MTAFSDRVQAALASGYTIERELTGGGMSHVFLATESALGRSVVIKVLPPELAAGVNRERFRREIHLAAQLQHPHIVPLLTAGEHGDLLYYTMPYVSGESLRARLEQQGRLSVRDVIRLLSDIVDALAYAHAHGVVHRDIKPGNVLTQRSHALVTDFGVAKALSASLPMAGFTTSGMAIGTPAYMAPEQLAADPAADHRVDLYAVGLLAYELLTGEAPFTGTSPAATMAAQLTRDPDPIETRRADVPPALSAIITRCLSKDPDGRPATAEALLAELEELPREPFTPTRPVPADRSWTRRLRPLFATVGIAAGVAAAMLVANRDSPSATPETAAIPTLSAGDSIVPDVAAEDTLRAAPASVLTRADSMAIAEAVRRELAREHARTQARPQPRAQPSTSTAATVATRALDADSLARAIGLGMMDSLRRINRTNLDERLALIPGFEGKVFTTQTPPVTRVRPSGPRRVRVVNVRSGGSPYADVERVLADSVRAFLGRLRSFVVVPEEAPAESQDGGAGRDLVVTVGMMRVGADSVRARIDLIDPLAAPSFVHRSVRGRPAPASDPLRNVRETAATAATTLMQMAHAPRTPDGASIVVPDPANR